MDDLALALELADACDSITFGRYGAADLAVETKADATPVSEADRSAEETVRARLETERPDDAVVGEEYGSSTAAGDRRWIIDPIDGTKNYVRGIPVWATLLALEEAGEPRVAVVSAPALGRRWWAARGEGAFVRDAQGERRLQVSTVNDLSGAQVSFGDLEEWRTSARLDAMLTLVEHSARSRGLGDFWSYMLVAEGAVEIALDPIASLWDLAAMQLIVEEAGGRFTDLSGRRTADGGNAIATNGWVHDAALAIIGRTG